MIRSLAFEPSLARVRRARFVGRPNVPLDAACVVANGVREALRPLIGEVALTIGEPVAVEAPAWRGLVRDAFAFVAPGRVTDVIFTIGRRDARTLVQAAFGETGGGHDGLWSPLEGGALERIVGRCAAAALALCGERKGPVRAVVKDEIPPFVAFFDVRIAAPVALTVGIGMTRDLPAPVPVAALGSAALGHVKAGVRVVLGRGFVPASSFLGLRVGDRVPLVTKVDGEGELNVAGQRIALGRCGVVHGHAAFEIRSISMGGDAS